MLKKIIFLIFVTCFSCFNIVFAAESGGMPQLNPEFWISQIFWLIITFGILFIVLTKVILPKISDNLETRKSQILENIETADKQKEESQKKIDEYEKIILDSKLKAKSYFNEAREKILDDINKKRAAHFDLSFIVFINSSLAASIASLIFVVLKPISGI